MKRFRFDDICINSNMQTVNKMTDFLLENFEGCEVIWAVSPIVSKSEKDKQRVFPSIYNAHSNKSIFYNVDGIGIPQLRKDVTFAGHGLIHTDHRLLDYDAQEMSVLTSCNLIGAKTFVPPFNKYNGDTINICFFNDIELIKWEEGWRCMDYEKWDGMHDMWYIHHNAFTFESFLQFFLK